MARSSSPATRPAEIALFRLNSNGTLDTTFGNDGLVTVSVSAGSDTANALAVESDGSILVGAAIGNASGGSSAGLVHFNSDGSLDIGFGTAGVLSFPTLGTGLDAMLQQPDGDWLLLGGGGGASIDSGAPSGFVLRLNPDFSIDTTFGSQGVASFSYGEFYDSLALQPDGKILIAGGEGPNAGGASTIGRLNPDGSLDTTFGQGGSVAAGFSNGISDFASVFVQPDGRIVAVGSADGYDTAVRYFPDGQLDPSFASGGKLQFALSADDFDTTGTAVTLPDGDIVMTIESEGLPLLAAILPETPTPALAPGQQPGQLVFATATASVERGEYRGFHRRSLRRQRRHRDGRLHHPGRHGGRRYQLHRDFGDLDLRPRGHLADPLDPDAGRFRTHRETCRSTWCSRHRPAAPRLARRISPR